jgi:hypothetical protein
MGNREGEAGRIDEVREDEERWSWLKDQPEWAWLKEPNWPSSAPPKPAVLEQLVERFAQERPRPRKGKKSAASISVLVTRLNRISHRKKDWCPEQVRHVVRGEAPVSAAMRHDLAAVYGVLEKWLETRAGPKTPGGAAWIGKLDAFTRETLALLHHPADLAALAPLKLRPEMRDAVLNFAATRRERGADPSPKLLAMAAKFLRRAEKLRFRSEKELPDDPDPVPLDLAGRADRYALWAAEVLSLCVNVGTSPNPVREA